MERKNGSKQISEELKSLEINLEKPTGTWLQIENQLVNMDRMDCVTLNEFSYAGKSRVVIFPPGDGDPFKAYEGDQKMCQEYMQALADYLGAKKIVIYKRHPCECKCGCKNEALEGDHICDYCLALNHDHVELKS